jgi:hypothetical protein
MARSLNLDKRAAPDEIQQFRVEVGKLAPKKYQSWDTTDAIKNEKMKSLKETLRILDKQKRGDALNTEELAVVNQIETNAVGRLKEILETAPPEEFDLAFRSYMDDIFKITSDANSEAGRALNWLKREVSVRRIGDFWVKNQVKKLNPRQKEALRYLNTEDPYEVKRFLNEFNDPLFRDYFYEFWYNSILSGPPTHLVNVISNTTWGAFQLPHRALVGGVDKSLAMLTGRQQQIFAREVAPMLAGYRTGFLKGKAGAAEMIRTGKIQQFETKWARDMGHNVLGAFARSPNAKVRAVAPYISAPTRALRAADVWANSIAFDSQMNALAFRAGRQQGLKGKALVDFTREFLSAPPKAALKEAAQFAKTATFMDDPGKIVSWMIQGRNKIPLARIVVPFVNTIANLTIRGVEMTPGLGLLAARGKLPAEVIAKQIEGTMLSAYMLYKADIGDITGPAPENKAEREAFYREGKLAWAIRIGDKWYQYRRFEPFNTVIASAAIAYKALEQAKNEEDATLIFSKYAEGMIDNLIDSSYMQGLSDVVFNRYERRESALRRTAASITPFSSFWRSIMRAYEVATTGETKLRESKSLLGAFAQVIPRSVLSLGIPDVNKKVPPKQDVFGEDIIIPGGVVRQFLPYKAAEITKDPVEIEFARLNAALKKKGQDTLFLGMPEKEINGNELTDEQYREYVQIRGKLARQRFEPRIKSSAWKNVPDSIKRRQLSNQWAAAGHIARLQMKANYPKLAMPGKFKKKEAAK